ncbi:MULTISPECIES: S16 family serine protease [unclassified Embleya]|uniref:YlbL family protein n=1 Tax=unclassified Embleya TaxID=2699296 RepID=UPI0033C00622
MPGVARTKLTLPVSLLLVAILFLFAFLVPMPYVLITPGSVADTLGEDGGRPVVEISGPAAVYPTTGHLLLTTIHASGRDDKRRLASLIGAWWDSEESVVPRKSVYPDGKSVEQVVETNVKDMVKSQDSATVAALKYLGKSPDQVKVTLHLNDVGGPSAGLFFALGIVDKLTEGQLTGGRTIAGTGAIDANGKVGEIGGLPMKLLAAKRAGATVFVLPKGECGEAGRVGDGGLRLIPVETLSGAVSALEALNAGGKVPSC